MKKFVLLLPIFLGLCLLAVWKSKSRATQQPHPPAALTATRLPEPSSTSKTKQAAPFPKPLEAESPELQETRALLAELSDLARRLEQEGVWIQRFRAKHSQPDPTMWKLRLLGHRLPAAMKVIEQFVRSDEPLAARVFAVFSFVAPQSEETIEFIASLMRDSPSSAMVNAACLCCNAWAANGIGGAWDSLFGTYSGMLGFPKPRVVDGESPMWGEQRAFVYLPDDWQAHQDLYKSHSFKLDLTPIVQAIVPMLAAADEDVWRNTWMKMAWQIMKHPKATPGDRERLRELTIKWYLEYDPGPGWDPKANGYKFGNGWFAAMESLTKAWSPPELNAVAGGLARLTPDHKTYVLEEVAPRAKSQLFAPPFSDHLDDVLANLDRPTGPQEGSYMHICVAMIVHAPSEAWSRQLLVNRGAILRQRIADGIAAWANGGDYKEVYGRRFFKAAEFLVFDGEFGVRMSAARTLYGLKRKGSSVLSVSDLQRSNELLKDWVSRESAQVHSEAQANQFQSFVSQLN